MFKLPKTSPQNQFTVLSGKLISRVYSFVGAIFFKYLSFNPTNKVWVWHSYNIYNTSKPIVSGQLVAIYLEDKLNNSYWSNTTTGVVPYALQNTNGEKSAKTKCIGLVSGYFIDIIS